MESTEGVAEIVEARMTSAAKSVNERYNQGAVETVTRPGVYWIATNEPPCLK
jgi:hypothetical protein